MDQRFLVKFALKNLLAHKLRTLLTITAMLIGVSAIVFLVSFAFGLERLVSKQVTGGNAFEMIDIGTGNSHIIKLNNDSLQKLSEISSIKEIEKTASAAAKYKKDENSPEFDASFFITSAKYMDWLGETIKYGDSLSDSNTPGANSDKAVISENLAKKINPQNPSDLVGKQIEITVVIPKELRDSSESKVTDKQIYIVGGISKEDVSADIYVNLDNISKYEVNVFSQAKAQVSSRDDITSTRQRIENLGFKTQYMGETISQVQQVFNFFKLILGSFGLIALIVASLGMFNTLTISLLERIKEVALLKMLGVRRRDLIKIFLTEAVAMGFFGGILGIIFGLILSNVVNSIFNSYAIKSGGESISAFYSPFWFLLSVFIFTTLVGLLTGLYPARRATRVNALDVLRYE